MRAPSSRLGPRAVVVLVATLLLLGAAGCSGDDEAPPDPGGPVDGAAATTEAPPSSGSTASTAPTSAPDATGGPTAFTDTAADAVNELKAAWESGDRARATAIAPGDVVEALFTVPPDGFEVYGCDTGEFDTSSCNYRNRGTGAYIKVTSARTDQGWQISMITVT